MAEELSIVIPRAKLGSQGFEVSKLGFGCMGLSGDYNDPVPKEVGISIIKHAFNKGITFSDTSDFYGANTDEVLVGKVLKHLPREKVQLSTKFGIAKYDAGVITVIGTPKYVRACCKASLKRLDVKYIELHVMELGIGIVPCSPLGGGFFGGKAVLESVHANSLLKLYARFTGENLDKNKILYSPMEKLAAQHESTTAQLAFAWVLHQGDDVVPIPRTTKIKNVDNNLGSVRVKLTKEDLEEISAVIPIKDVAGDRTKDNFIHSTWKFANTPAKDSTPATTSI